ncbi:uncharacterized protein [Physcomitrium patens]|uniref:CRAL-TRIO domain-containing protein n=1 Tax=Physcomitrium patens TaxID=3218 RepID=A0A2K1KJH4_PHYPA|nr:uncharacterized protein LOC112281987 isoform X1 [Physcomitrium patens]XP_024374819.1 uncharacterized protein LOC112281987 isoform X1 [Physcomitrium patens]XP_024374820.1 uncharacterized protein LOC112281987 isoform X1 [Physcomitrium patens]PNR53929.1 hypothetical protein PHYPA_007604 [Physcomitrium patens]|eukprot:XP_024374818.1 uncharacterized protein LOC112281987 isoform X1 [Physcomitrella patens]
MHRGRSRNHSHCHDRSNRESLKKSLGVDEECGAQGTNKPWKLTWNLSLGRGKNSAVSSNLAVGKHKRIVIIREQSANVVAQEEARLDLKDVNNVIAFLSTLQQVPNCLGTKSLHNVLAKPDIQGRARAVLSTLHNECKKQLKRNDSAKGTMESELGSSFSCKVSRGPTLNHSLEWPGRHNQLQKQICLGISSLNPNLAANGVDFSSFLLLEGDETGEPRAWERRNDMQQRQPSGWWRRTLLGSLAGAVVLRIMFFRFPWLLLPHLFTLPCFRRSSRPTHKKIMERKNWWHLPGKLITTVSIRFCGSLSNSVVAANLLLLIFELRNMIDSGRLADVDLTMLQGRFQRGRGCCSCASSCNQGGSNIEPSGFSRPCGTCCLNSCGALDQAVIDDKLPLNWKEGIGHLIDLAQKGRDVRDKSAVLTSREDIVHLAELIHAALSMPKDCFDKLLHAQLRAPAPSLELKTDFEVEKGFVTIETEDVIDQKADSEDTNLRGELSNPMVVVTNPGCQNTLTDSSNSIEGHPEETENSALLRSILLGKHKTYLHSFKSSACPSDVESECFFETSMSLPDLENLGYQQVYELDTNSDKSENWRSAHSDASTIDVDEHVLAQEPNAGHCHQGSDCLDDQSVVILNREESFQTINSEDSVSKCQPHSLSTTAECGAAMILSDPSSDCHHFSDHPTCISLRERRHEHGDQKYLSIDELNSLRWRELVFWHGHCRRGNPTLHILLGKAIQKLPPKELQTISSVIISHLEYAELNFFKASAKQINIIMDLWGIGLMRIPPLEVLSHVGMIMNRDYAGRGGSMLLVNAPMMLSLVIGGIKRVLLRPGYNNSAMIEKGFFENKDRILFLNRNYKHALEEHFELTSLPSMFGGKCSNKFCPEGCNLQGEYYSETESSGLHQHDLRLKIVGESKN